MKRTFMLRFEYIFAEHRLEFGLKSCFNQLISDCFVKHDIPKTTKTMTTKYRFEQCRFVFDDRETHGYQ